MLLLLAPCIAAAQEPLPRGSAGMEKAAAELARRLDAPRTVELSNATWTCRGNLCVAAVARDAGSAELCAALRGVVGEIARFRRGSGELGAPELRSCNGFALARPSGKVELGDGIAGRRLPDERTIEPIARAELRIAGVTRVSDEPIAPGGSVTLEVVVENTGGAAATVALQLIDASRGASRRSYTSPATITAHSTASWRVDLTAAGSEPAGDPRCGERSVRLVSLVTENRPAGAPPGYRPGTREGTGWVTFSDANPDDNARVVSFTFECAVTIRVEPSGPPR